MVGKTTVVKKLVDELISAPETFGTIAGFYTEEVCESWPRSTSKSHPRIGFDVVTFNGTRKPLARIIRFVFLYLTV